MVSSSPLALDKAEDSRADHVIAHRDGLKTISDNDAIAPMMVMCADWK